MREKKMQYYVLKIELKWLKKYTNYITTINEVSGADAEA
jgi:hypothetical protein